MQRTDLNWEQAKGLANFLFDMAKGLALGGIGSTVALPKEARLLAVLVGLITAFAFAKFALQILEQVE